VLTGFEGDEAPPAVEPVATTRSTQVRSVLQVLTAVRGRWRWGIYTLSSMRSATDMRSCCGRDAGGAGVWCGRRGIPAFPFCHVTLRGREPRTGYPEHPATIGQHLKKLRLDRGLRQKDAAPSLGSTSRPTRTGSRGSTSRRSASSLPSSASWG